MPVNAGGSVTFTAINGKGTFSGWTGACQGTSLTCTSKVKSDAPVTATFTPPVRLTVNARKVAWLASGHTGSKTAVRRALGS